MKLGIVVYSKDPEIISNAFQFAMFSCEKKADGLIHAGQASYIRGLRQGKGWLKY